MILFLITTATTKSYVEENSFDKMENNIIRKSKARAKYLIICTGIKHIKPQIKNFEDYDGNGIWHCPHCDGFETVNKKLIVIASDNENNKAYRLCQSIFRMDKRYHFIYTAVF